MNRINITMATFLVAIVFIFSTSCSSENKGNSKPKDYSNETIADQEIWHKTFEVDSGWGYDIYVDGNVYIHQEFIPAKEGFEKFSTEQKAEAAALLVISKLRRNINPPEVNLHELDSVGALH